MKKIKCIVASYNANGEPDLYFCQVLCTQEQFDNGDHYDCAIKCAKDNGYEGDGIAFDEFDNAGKTMLGLFCWESLSQPAAVCNGSRST